MLRGKYPNVIKYYKLYVKGGKFSFAIPYLWTCFFYPKIDIIRSWLGDSTTNENTVNLRF